MSFMIGRVRMATLIVEKNRGARDSWLDENFRARFDHFVKLRDLRVPHPHTAMTRLRADLRLVIRAVDVDVTLARILVFGSETFEPKDARLHEIILLVFAPDF